MAGVQVPGRIIIADSNDRPFYLLDLLSPEVSHHGPIIGHFDPLLKAGRQSMVLDTPARTDNQ
jgi:hypothetical protein